MVCASRGQLEFSLLFLILGAAFDGFDGAAARRWGGTRWGVYSDDIADGVNYGLAPGVAVYFTVGGVEGVVIGGLFTVLTFSRLVYFTLNKSDADPNYFMGVPSTTGGLITLCSLILFGEHVALLGLMVGIACVQMVSFNTYYRHLGRALGAHKRRALVGAQLYVLILVIGAKLWGPTGPVGFILAGNLVYSFWPVVDSFKKVVDARAETPP
jgi:CDP-diacylglycerol--serine O-phosphatidyltransferase